MLISLKIDWFDLFAVQDSQDSRTLRDSQESSTTLQFKGINFWHSAFFMVQLSQPYVTTGKT